MAHPHEAPQLVDHGPEVHYPTSTLEVHTKPNDTDYSDNDVSYAQKETDQDTLVTRSGRRHNLFGLGQFASGLLIGLLVAIILAAVLGGALGANLASCRSNSKAASEVAPNTINHTSTVTATRTAAATSTANATFHNYVPAAPSSVSSLALNCPALNNQGAQTAYGDRFVVYCGEDFSNGFPADGGGIIADFINIIAYSFEDCLEACSALNYRSQKYHRNNTTCRAVTFISDLGNYANGNCWLKNATLAVGKQAHRDDNACSAKLE